MTWPVWPRRLAPACLLWLLAACGPGSQQQRRATTTDTAPAADTAGTAVPKACDLLAADEVSAAVGVAYQNGIVAHHYGGSSQCRYDHEDGSQGIMFTLHRPGEIAPYRRVPGSEPVMSLGDTAVWNAGTNQLAVSVGETVFSISFLTRAGSRPAAARLAARVVEKLR